MMSKDRELRRVHGAMNIYEELLPSRERSYYGQSATLLATKLIYNYDALYTPKKIKNERNRKNVSLVDLGRKTEK